MHRFPKVVAGIAASFACSCWTAATAADSSAVDEYRTSFVHVYGGYQRVLAQRDACSTAFPESRGTYEKAYTVWRTRHARLVGELDRRFDMMVHRASRDEKDYARNLGKYEGAVLRQREEVKQTLLQQARPDLETQCKALPDFLQSADSDLEKEFANDLAIVRSRPLK